MSVYHKWRTVFVQIPKNASSAIHNALSNPTDGSHDHRMYIDILSSNDPELIESYFSFGICRNPYDRFVSAYEYLRTHGATEYEPAAWSLNFEETVDLFYKRGKFFYTNEDVVWWPQARFVAIKKIILVDKIIRYEDLASEWPSTIDEIMKKVPDGYSRPKDLLEKVNTSESREGKSWEEYYTAQTKEKVYELYKRDFELFNYPK